MSYSSDVFFKPWVGVNYPYGWFLDSNNNLQFGNGNNKCFKVMILGLEHYCIGSKPSDKNKEEKTIFDSTDYSNASYSPIKCCYSNCGHLFTCKDRTIDVIKEHIFAKTDKWVADALGIGQFNCKSHANFEEIYIKKTSQLNTNERKEFWDSMLFSNFFQRGMFLTSGNIYTDAEKDRAFKAFENIVNIHRPHIVFVWGDDVKDSLEPKIKYKHIPFLLKKLKLCQMGNNYNILLVYIDHTSPLNINKKYGGKKGYPVFFNEHILPAFQVAENLINNGLL